jgi:imidazole glycerol-phosphate synthase subunit HisH
MIGVIDYGIGNVKSIVNMFKKIGADVALVNTPEQICAVDKIVLPGVGSFDSAMIKLENSGLIDSIKKHALVDRKPLLGICLGMQMLGRNSEEGRLAGLDFIPFECKKFKFSNDSKLKIPHMGWDIVSLNITEDLLLQNLGNKPRYYFVHSFYAVCDNDENILMSCDYGNEFTAAVKNGNIYGVQFHPEKSHKFGMAILENFARNI